MGRLPRTLSVPEAGDCLGVGRTTAHRLARIYRESGGAYALPTIRVGRKLLVPGVLLAEHIAEDRITPPDFADRARNPPRTRFACSTDDQARDLKMPIDTVRPIAQQFDCVFMHSTQTASPAVSTGHYEGLYSSPMKRR